MLVQPLPQRNLDHAGGVVANDLLEILQTTPHENQRDHARQWPHYGRELGAFVDDLEDYDCGHGQARYPGYNSQHADYSGEQDPPPDAFGKCK